MKGGKEETAAASHGGEDIDPQRVLRRKIYSVCGGGEKKESLPAACLSLLADQKNDWPDLRAGYESLDGVMERGVQCTGFSVRLQYNPGRIKSTLAGVGKKEARPRRCFLCPEHLPNSQKGILYGGEYLILCNPAPIFAGHFTISHVSHRPQSVRGQIAPYLQLLAEFGSGWTVFYNGPECGASAPEHLHFQAVPSGRMPVEKEIRQENRIALQIKRDGFLVYSPGGLGRRVVILEAHDATAAAQALEAFLAGLKETLGAPDEPMLNIAGLYEKERWRLVVFPRRKHRPDAFYREGGTRVAVSPGLIDMGGVLITPVGKDFERLNAVAIEDIYEEVSLDDANVRRAMEAGFG